MISHSRSLFRDARFLALFLTISVVTGSCGSAGGSPSDSGSSGGASANCSLTLASQIAQIDVAATIPSWNQVDCYKSSLVKLTIPTFSKSVSLSAIGLPHTNSLGPTIVQNLDTAVATPGINMVSIGLGQVQPFFDSSTNLDVNYPISDTNEDLKMRSAALYVIDQKAKGRVVMLMHAWPSQVNGHALSFTGVTDEPSYRNYITNTFVPQKVLEAKMAEKYKVEYYAPFPAEVETAVTTMGIVFADPVATTQFVITQIINAIRPVYTGKLVAHSYINYRLHTEHWETLDFTGFDELDFSIIPICLHDSTDNVASYLSTQLAKYMQIVSRAGNISWKVGEVFMPTDVWGNPSACQSQAAFAAIELPIYQNIVNAIANLPTIVGFVSPVGINFDTYGQNKNTQTFVNNYLQTH